jgi:hypothetical protein
MEIFFIEKEKKTTIEQQFGHGYEKQSDMPRPKHHMHPEKKFRSKSGMIHTASSKIVRFSNIFSMVSEFKSLAPQVPPRLRYTMDVSDITRCLPDTE